jgi:hypothetical protein
VESTVAEGHQGNSGVGSLVGWNTTGRPNAMYAVAMNHQAAGAAETAHESHAVHQDGPERVQTPLSSMEERSLLACSICKY